MTDDILNFGREELETFVEEYMQLNRRVQQPKGLYSVLPGSREAQYQSTLAYFLDPQKPHGFGYTLLESFLRCIDFYEFNLAGQHIEIDDEVWIADDGSEGRIDLIICGGSALVDHPRWGAFLELKVGAKEGRQQTTTYAQTKRWNFNWFNTNRLDADRLADTTYVYLKRDAAATPSDRTGTFESVSWKAVVEQFESDIQEAMFEYPNRSVVQFTDFMESLRQTEGMDSSVNEDELNERLSVYFEHSDLIQQVEQANSQFESDFEDLSTYLKEQWTNKLSTRYEFEDSGWRVSSSSSLKWQKILPEYWDQDPLNSRSTIQLFYRHSPTTDLLRKQVLRFRLRLPPQRNVHTEEQESGRSFNEGFTEKCATTYAADIENAANKINADKTRVTSASALVTKDYQLDRDNLADSYFQQLDTAVEEFCTDQSALSTVVNSIFEGTYREVFDQEPVGSFPGPLPTRT